MDFKLARLDGAEILNGSTTWIYYASKEWRQLTTDDTSVNSAGYHGRRTSATFARKRVVTFEGYIQRFDNANEKVAVEYLQNLFCLQSNTGAVIPRTLYIKDMYDQEWTLPVKVREPVTFIEYSDDWKGAYWKWMAVLESVESPIYRSNTEISEAGTEGTIGGFQLGVAFPFTMNALEGTISCTNMGNIASTCRFVITVTDTLLSPITVYNVTDGTFFSLSISGTTGDIIEIDSEALTATKNGVSVIGSRVAGSIFPTITGTTQFVVSDVTNWYSDHFTVAVYFRDALL